VSTSFNKLKSGRNFLGILYEDDAFGVKPETCSENIHLFLQYNGYDYSYLLTYSLTHSLTHSLHGAECYLKS
jgi:hypothetical protein